MCCLLWVLGIVYQNCTILKHQHSTPYLAMKKKESILALGRSRQEVTAQGQPWLHKEASQGSIGGGVKMKTLPKPPDPLPSRVEVTRRLVGAVIEFPDALTEAELCSTSGSVAPAGLRPKEGLLHSSLSPPFLIPSQPSFLTSFPNIQHHYPPRGSHFSGDSLSQTPKPGFSHCLILFLIYVWNWGWNLRPHTVCVRGKRLPLGKT